MPDKIRIAIADDHTLFNDGLKQLLNEEPDMEIVDVAYDGKELLSILPGKKIDIILMDINMPNLNGLEATKYIKQSNRSVKVIILSTYNDEHLVEKARASGANGYLLKTANKPELLQTIRLTYAGQACFPYNNTIKENSFKSNDSFLKQFSLSKREIEILKLIRSNHTNQQIADKLFLSIYTVETHRKNIMQKTGLSGPAALMKFIIENNI